MCGLTRRCDLRNDVVMKLQQLLNERSWSRRQFAGRAQVAASTVSRYLNGNQIPRPDALRRMAEATDGALTASELAADAYASGTRPQGAQHENAA